MIPRITVGFGGWSGSSERRFVLTPTIFLSFHCLLLFSYFKIKEIDIKMINKKMKILKMKENIKTTLKYDIQDEVF